MVAGSFKLNSMYKYQVKHLLKLGKKTTFAKGKKCPSLDELNYASLDEDINFSFGLR